LRARRCLLPEGGAADIGQPSGICGSPSVNFSEAAAAIFQIALQEEADTVSRSSGSSSLVLTALGAVPERHEEEREAIWCPRQ